MDISSRYIKISGQFEIPSDLTIGRDYQVIMEGSTISSTDSDESDGTISRSWRFRPITGILEAEKGVSIPLKDRRSHSKRFRSMIMNHWGKDYNIVMDTLLAHSDELLKLYEELAQADS